MKLLAGIAYSIGLVAELVGAALVVRDARRALTAAAVQGQKPATYADLMSVNVALGDIRHQQLPGRRSIALLFAGIVSGYVGCFLSLG